MIRYFKGSLIKCSAKTKISFALICLKCFTWDVPVCIILLISGGFSGDETSFPKEISKWNIKFVLLFFMFFFFSILFLVLKDFKANAKSHHMILSNMNLQRIAKNIWWWCPEVTRGIPLLQIFLAYYPHKVYCEKSTIIWFRHWWSLNAQLCRYTIKDNNKIQLLLCSSDSQFSTALKKASKKSHL